MARCSSFNAKLDAVVVAEAEFVYVALQVLFAHAL
jgi:hypothetical protein